MTRRNISLFENNDPVWRRAGLEDKVRTLVEVEKDGGEVTVTTFKCLNSI